MTDQLGLFLGFAAFGCTVLGAGLALFWVATRPKPPLRREVDEALAALAMERKKDLLDMGEMNASAARTATQLAKTLQGAQGVLGGRPSKQEPSSDESDEPTSSGNKLDNLRAIARQRGMLKKRG